MPQSPPRRTRRANSTETPYTGHDVRSASVDRRTRRLPNKYTEDELAENLARKAQARTGDLTSFAAMLGDSFALKIDWLAQLIRDAHDPSLGNYKERLLKTVIADFIPKRYEVGTGFVLFPTQQLQEVSEALARTAEVQATHEVSKQLDIIVYDSSNFPVVFRDEDFVVVRPEAVNAIIEVKGSLDQPSTTSVVDLFIDYGRKWKRCKDFYGKNSSVKLFPPDMSLMAWSVAMDQRGRPKTDGSRLRKRIVEHYKSQISRDELNGLPLLHQACIYADCIVSDVITMGGPLNLPPQFGYSTTRGRLVRYPEKDQPVLAGDGTIASLLAGIQASLDTPFNAPMSYVDQTRRLNVLPHEHEGFECLVEAKEAGELRHIAPNRLQAKALS